MSLSYIKNVAFQLAGYIITPVARHVGYVLLAEGRVNDLKRDVTSIGDAIEETQHAIERAQTTDENVIEKKVVRWSNEAEEFQEKAQQLISRRRSATQCHLCVVNPYTRYQLGRRATHASRNIQNHIQSRNLDRISYRRSPTGIATSLSSQGSVQQLESRNSMLNEIMKALEDDTVSRVGVHGPGGVGKTTLLLQVAEEAMSSKEFDEVVTALVSQNPDSNRIRAEIRNVLQRVSLKSEKDGEDKLAKARPSEPTKKAATKTKRVVLIILDDLWKKFDLEDLGIGEKEDKITVKLLMTSRDRHLLVSEMDCQVNFHLEILKEEEAWDLFESIVGKKLTDPSLKAIAEELAKKCRGSPLHLDALAKLLQKSDPKDWEGASEQLKKSDTVQKPLELSFKRLDSRQFNLLHIISSLDGRGGIRVEALVRYAIGLGLFAGHDGSVQAARNGMRSSLDGLRAASLLLDCVGHCVKVHDLVRDGVISSTHRDRHALVLQEEKDLKDLDTRLQESKAIFLPYPDFGMESSVWKCQELEILVAFAGKDRPLEIPDLFFAFMPKLKVLGLSYASTKRLTSSIRYLKSLQTLCLDYCDLEDVRIVGELVNLQVLSFIGSEITRLPQEIGELAELRLLDLSHCSKLEVIERGALDRLVNLEELYMENSFVRWEIGRDEKQNNSTLADLNKMTQLSNLDVHVPDVAMLQENLPFGKLSKYRIHIGDTWDWSGEYKGSKTLKLQLECNWILSEEWFQLTLHRTEHLHLYRWSGTRISVHELCQQGFRELKHLHVEESPAAYYVVRSSESFDEVAFSILESLFLKNLVNLERICHGLLRKESFARLRDVTVHGCNKLKNLFSLSLARGLRELKTIEVTDCSIMQEVVIAERKNQDDENKEVEEEAMRCSVFGKSSLVQRLVSTSIPTPCCSTRKKVVEDETEDDDDEEDKVVEDRTTRCGVLGKSRLVQGLVSTNTLTPCCFPIKEVVENDYVQLPRLRELRLVNLPNLTSFFMDANYPREARGDSAAFFDGKQVSLPFLEVLKLIELPKLTRLWQMHPSIVLSKLQSLEVSRCRNLLKAIDSVMVMKLQSLKSLSIKGCDSLVEVFDLQQLGPAGGNAKILPQLQTLELEKLQRLRCVWTKSPKGVLGFRNVTLLSVKACNYLRYLFTSSMAKAMKKLKEIHVEDCDNIEAIVADHDASAKPIALTSLKVLSIISCQRMKSFLISHYREPKEMESTTISLKKKLLCHGMQGPEGLSHTAVFFNERVLVPSLEKLRLSDLGQFQKIWPNKLPKKSFCSLESLSIELCDDLSVVLPSTLTKRLNKLKSIVLKNCDSLGMLFEPVFLESGRKQKQVTLPELKEVVLERLPSLACFVPRDSSMVVRLPSLTKIDVSGCDLLRYLLPETRAAGLSKLEEVSVSGCRRMRELIAKGEGEGVRINAIVFPRLRSVVAYDLNDLICFCSGDCTFDFPSLANVSIAECPNTKAFILMPGLGESPQAFFNEKVELPNLQQLTMGENSAKELWHKNAPQRSFWKLKELDIRRSTRLLGVIPPLMKKRLQRLEVLKIEDYRSIEKIEELVEDFDATCDINTSQETSCLTDPTLSLTSIWNDDSLSSFPIKNLTQIEVSKCKIAYLFTTSQAKCLEHLQRLVVNDSEIMKHVVVQENRREAADGTFFPNLTSLQLSALPVLSSFYEGRHARVSQFPGTLFSSEKVHLCSLKELNLEGLKELKRLWREDARGILFPQNLRVVRAVECGELRHVFPASVAKGLLKLEKLEVVVCELLEVVVTKGEEEGDQSNIPKTIFHQLAYLKLERLSKLKSFIYSGAYVSHWPLLKSLAVSGCAPLLASDFATFSAIRESGSTSAQPLFLFDKILFPCLEILVISGMDTLRELWHGQIAPDSFKRIAEMEVIGCRELMAVLPSKLVHVFGNLEKLKIEDCSRLHCLLSTSYLEKAPVQLDELAIPSSGLDKIVAAENEGPPTFIFHRLTHLELTSLPEVKSLYPEPHTSLWPCLELLTIENCNGIQTLFGRSQQPFFLVNEVSFPCLETIWIDGSSNLQMVWDSRMEADAFDKLRQLVVIDCPTLVTLFPSNMVLEGLDQLYVISCISLEVIYDLQGLISCTEPHRVGSGTTRLRSLTLQNLMKLKCPWSRNPRGILDFRNLQSVTVSGCGSLEYLFPTSIAKSLFQLEELILEDSGLKVVVGGDEEGEVTSSASFTFPRLAILRLSSLPHLEGFNPGNHISRWPLLEELTISNVGVLNSFVYGSRTSPTEEPHMFLVNKYTFPSLRKLEIGGNEKLKHIQLGNPISKRTRCIWKGNSRPWSFSDSIRDLVLSDFSGAVDLLVPSSVSFLNLTSLEVSKCHGCKALLTSPTTKSLAQLKKMIIKECGALTEAVAGGSDNGMDEVSFDKLEELRLEDLASITHFCSGDYALKFPSLETLVVSGCTFMRAFHQGDLSAPKLGKVWTDTDEDNWIWDANLNGTIRQIYNNKEGLVTLTSFKLSASPPEWKELWLNHHPPRFFAKLTELVMEDCGFLTAAAIPSDKFPILKNLGRLEIRNCRAVERVFDSPQDVTEDGRESSESALRTIHLSNLPMLTLVIPDNLPSFFSFSVLKAIEIDNCSSLKTMLSPATALNLPWLDKIKISNCEMLEEVIGGGNEADQTQGHIRLEYLESITLESLPMLVGFCPGSRSLDCPWLENITIRDCPKMKTFTSPLPVKKTSDVDDEKGEERSRRTSSWPKGDGQVHDEPFFNEKVLFPEMNRLVLSHVDSLSIIWHHRLADRSFSKLFEMEIEHCGKLLKVFPPESVERFARLRTLTISHCDSLEGVFGLPEIGVTRDGGRGREVEGDGESRQVGDESKDGSDDVTMLLSELTLSHLPQLKSICSIETEGVVSFKYLEPVRVVDCPKLESFPGVSFATE